jgi:hypothetical protein
LNLEEEDSVFEDLGPAPLFLAGLGLHFPPGAQVIDGFPTECFEAWTMMSGRMPTDIENQVGAGFGATAAGDWSGARDAFVAALEVDEVPEALMGLANACYFLGDLAGMMKAFLVGDRDRLCPVEEGVTAYRALQNGELAVLPNTPAGLNPAAVRTTIEFFERHTSTTP